MTGPHDQDSPRLLTVAEAAQYLSMHPGSVRRLVQEGRLPAYRLGQTNRGRLRVRQSDLDALLRATTDGGAEGAPGEEGGA